MATTETVSQMPTPEPVSLSYLLTAQRRFPVPMPKTYLSEKCINVRCIVEVVVTHVSTTLSEHLGASFRESLKEHTSWIEHFYDVLIRSVSITIGQLLHSVILFDRAVESDKMRRTSPVPVPSFVTEYTYGTVLLCSVIIAHKMNEDNCYTNRYFSYLYHVPLEYLNSSEVNLFEALSYSTSVNPDDLPTYLSKLVSR